MRDQIRDLMRRVREGLVPSSEVIVAEAFRELGYTPGRIGQPQVRGNFNAMLHEVWVRTLEVLERYEHQAYSVGVARALMRLRDHDVEEVEQATTSRGLAEAFPLLFQRLYPYLRLAFLSIGQSRMTRGGRDFELQVQGLLDLMHVPYDRGRRGSPVDFTLPSRQFFGSNPTAAALLSVKRTLRERWREVAGELYETRAPKHLPPDSGSTDLAGES